MLLGMFINAFLPLWTKEMIFSLYRVQLAVCLSVILKYDFPGRWDTVVDQMLHYISMENPQVWYGAFIAVYQLVKNYE